MKKDDNVIDMVPDKSGQVSQLEQQVQSQNAQISDLMKRYQGEQIKAQLLKQKLDKMSEELLAIEVLANEQAHELQGLKAPIYTGGAQ